MQLLHGHIVLYVFFYCKGWGMGWAKAKGMVGGPFFYFLFGWGGGRGGIKNEFGSGGYSFFIMSDAGWTKLTFHPLPTSILK